MQNLRLLRDEYKLSQLKLAEQFNLAQSQIQSYEAGTYEPDIAMLKALADFFEVSVDFLIGRTTIRRMAEPVEEYALNAEEQTLVDRCRGLLPNQRRSLAMFIDTLAGE